MSGETAQDKLKLFVSYSRRDLEVADALVAALEAVGFEVLIDRRDLPYGEEWQDELAYFIQTADAVLWLVSPRSVVSDWCNWELGLVERLKKRLVPIRIFETPSSSLPKAISKLHLLPAEGVFSIESHLGALADTLHTDRVWLKEATRIADRARQWIARGRNPSLLLRGAALRDADSWLEREPARGPSPPGDVLELLLSSRRAATRRQRYWLAGSIVVLICAAALASFAYIQRNEAARERDQRTLVLAQSDTELATQLVLRREPIGKPLALLARAVDTGVGKLAEKVLWKLMQERAFWVPGPDAAGFAFSPEPASVGVVAPHLMDALKRQIGREAITHAAASTDGSLIVTVLGGGPGSVIRWRLWDGAARAVSDWINAEYTGDSYLYALKAYPSPDGRFVALEHHGMREAAYMEVYDVGQKKRLSGMAHARGLDPLTEGARFDIVRFVTCPSTLQHCAGPLLLLGSSNGGASAWRISKTSIFEASSMHAYDNPVRIVTIDETQERFFSLSANGKLTVSALTRLNPKSGQLNWYVHQILPEPLQLRSPSPSMALRGKEVIISDGSGQPFALSIHPPVAARSSFTTRPEDRGWCVAKESGASVGTPPTGLRVNRIAGRRLDLTLTSGEQTRSMSRIFPADVAFVCGNRSADRVIVGLDNLVSQVWRADLSERIGVDLDESVLVIDGRRPKSMSGAYLSVDGSMVAVKTSLYDPPNLEYAWVSLWVAETGLPIGSRHEFVDDGSENAADLPDGAVFSVGGDAVLFETDCSQGKCRPMKMLELRPPPEFQSRIARLAEAVGGVRYDVGGTLVQMSNDERRGVLSAMPK